MSKLDKYAKPKRVSKPKPKPAINLADEQTKDKRARRAGLTERLDSHTGYGYSIWCGALEDLNLPYVLIRTHSAAYLLTRPEYAAAARVLIAAARDRTLTIWDTAYDGENDDPHRYD